MGEMLSKALDRITMTIVDQVIKEARRALEREDSMKEIVAIVNLKEDRGTMETNPENTGEMIIMAVETVGAKIMMTGANLIKVTEVREDMKEEGEEVVEDMKEEEEVVEVLEDMKEEEEVEEDLKKEEEVEEVMKKEEEVDAVLEGTREEEEERTLDMRGRMILETKNGVVHTGEGTDIDMKDGIILC